MEIGLLEKKRAPCRDGVPPLTPEEAENHRKQALERELRDDATRIPRIYRLKNFGDASRLAERAAALAEVEGHHSDIRFGWGYLMVSLQTKKINRLHENDFIMAAKLDRIVAEPRETDG